MFQKPTQNELFCKNEVNERKPAAAPGSKRAATATNTAASSKKTKIGDDNRMINLI